MTLTLTFSLTLAVALPRAWYESSGGWSAWNPLRNGGSAEEKMMSRMYAWVDAVPREKFAGRLPRIDVVIPRPSSPICGVICCRSLVGVILHWTGARTLPCSGDASECEGCLRGFPTRYKAYLPINSILTGRVVIAQLTTEAVAAEITLSDPGCDLIGLQLKAWRSGKSVTSRMVAEVRGPKQPTLELSADTVKDALVRLWSGKGKVRR